MTGTYVDSRTFKYDPLVSHRQPRDPANNVWYDCNKSVAATTQEVDVLVHFHGYMPYGVSDAKMLDDSTAGKVRISGLSGTLDRYPRPLVAIVPLGKHTGPPPQPTVGSEYDFPFLTAPRVAPARTPSPATTLLGAAVLGPAFAAAPMLVGAGMVIGATIVLRGPDNLTTLINSVLADLQANGRIAGAKVGRLILTAHSGGGAAMDTAIGLVDPHELYFFDAAYSDPVKPDLTSWLKAHMQSPPTSGTASRSGNDRFFRFIYMPPCTAGTLVPPPHAKVATGLGTVAVGCRPQCWVQQYVRSTTLYHDMVPQTFCPSLLANPQDDLKSLNLTPPLVQQFP